MSRYDKEHKQATRQRILETACDRFKTDGIDGSGVAALMADAGLTNGAFYAHFSSKDDLVANVVADQLGAQARILRVNCRQAGRDLEEFLHEYLSPQHRDNPGAGCPSRRPAGRDRALCDRNKDAYTDGARSIVDEIACRLGSRGSAVRVREGARAVHDGGGHVAAVPGPVRPEFADEVLRTGHPERPRVPSLSIVAQQSGFCVTGPSTHLFDGEGPAISRYRWRNARALATNCSWNWKMPPCPASG